MTEPKQKIRGCDYGNGGKRPRLPGGSVVVDYLVKPFTYDRFRIAIDKYVSQVAALKDLDTTHAKKQDYTALL